MKNRPIKPKKVKYAYQNHLFFTHFGCLATFKNNLFLQFSSLLFQAQKIAILTRKRGKTLIFALHGLNLQYTIKSGPKLL